MGKVKITQEQADEIKGYRDRGLWDDSDMVRHHATSKWNCKGSEHLNEFEPDDLIRALYIGYEVECTPYDRLRKYYARYSGVNKSVMSYAISYAIIETLNILGITVRGINGREDDLNE